MADSDSDEEWLLNDLDRLLNKPKAGKSLVLPKGGRWDASSIIPKTEGRSAVATSTAVCEVGGDDGDVVDLTSPSPAKPPKGRPVSDSGPRASLSRPLFAAAPATITPTTTTARASPDGTGAEAAHDDEVILMEGSESEAEVDDLPEVPSFCKNTFRSAPPGQPSSKVAGQSAQRSGVEKEGGCGEVVGGQVSPFEVAQPSAATEGDCSPPPAEKKRTAAEVAEQRADKRRQAEERKEAARRAKEEQRAAAKAAKEAEKLVVKAAKKNEKELAQQAKGRFALREIRVKIGKGLAQHELGWAVMRSLQEEDMRYDIEDAHAPGLQHLRVITWGRQQLAASQPPPSSGSTLPGSSQPAEEAIPYVLVALKAEEFVECVEQDGARGLIRQVASAFPSATLGLQITGLAAYLKKREGAERGFSRATTEGCLAVLHTHYEGVYHRLVVDVAEAAEHIKTLTIALAKQPYEDQENFFAHFGGGTGKVGRPGRTADH